jgi:hypothetical protein
MNNRSLAGGFMVFLGLLASLEGFARILSGNKDLYHGSKHPWLKGFFMLFGTYAPYAATAFSFLIAACFFYVALRVFRSPNVGKKTSTRAGSSN